MPLQKHAEEASSRLRAAAEALQGCTSLTAALLARGHQVDVSYRLPALGRLHCCLSMCGGASTALSKVRLGLAQPPAPPASPASCFLKA